MRQKNWTLIMGGLLLGFLIFTLIFPELFSSRNPYALSFIKFWLSDTGQLQMATPPYVPSSVNPLGSDQMGRDLLSFLVYGSRLTLLLALGVALSRFVLAIPLGIAAGMGRFLPQRMINRFNLVLTTIPPLLIAILVLRMDFFSSLYKAQSTAFFIITLTLIGWSKVASILGKSTAHIMSETYILAERAIGKRPLQLAKSHVFPHLLPEIIILFFMEIASVLTLMMQLGLFSVFVGNLKIIRDSSRNGFSYFNVTFEPEWSSLLGSARDYIRVAPWIALAAGVMFFITVLAFNLIGEGLRMEFQKKNSHYKDFFKPLIHKKAVLTYLVVIIAVVLLKWPSTYTFTENITPNTLKSSEISNLSQSDQSRKWIKDQMITLGLEPAALDNRYIQSFEGSPGLDVKAFELTTPTITLVSGQDIVLLNGKSVSGSYWVINATDKFYQLSPELLKGKLIYVDTDIVRPESIASQLKFLADSGAVGLILTEGLKETTPHYGDLAIMSILPEHKKAFESISLSAAAGAALPTGTQAMVRLSINATAIDGSGQNIFAKIVGNEKTMAQNTLIIGMNYHALTPEKRLEKMAFYLNLMANMKTHGDQLNRTIIFAFFDGPDGINYYSEHALVQNKHVNLYLDLTDLEGDGFESLAFSDELSPISRYYGFIFANQFKQNAKEILTQQRISLSDSDRFLFAAESLTTLNFKTVGSGNLSLGDFGTVFIKTLIENAY